MDVDSYRNSPIGSVMSISGHDGRFGNQYQHFAYVPAPLPDDPQLSSTTWKVIAAAMLALGRLDQAGRQIPDTFMLRRPTLRREAQSTSALEGTFAPLLDVLEVEPDDAVGSQSPELSEVLNYVRAAEHAYAAIGDDRPISTGLLFELHKMLVSGTMADGPEAGQVRTVQVAIGAAGGRIEEARFVPPPPGIELQAALRDWADWIELKTKSPQDCIVAAALGHYQFETLHPFNDGNGRIGRLVIVLQLMRSGVLRDPLLTLSPWFETRRVAYQDNLQRVSISGDWDTWVQFFAEGIRAQAESTAAKVGDMLAYRDEARQRARSAGLKGLAIDVLDDLISWPVFTTASVASRRGVTPPAATAAIKRLINLDILGEMTGRAYGRVYACRRVLQILQS